jgi:hypothetical protein
MIVTATRAVSGGQGLSANLSLLFAQVPGGQLPGLPGLGPPTLPGQSSDPLGLSKCTADCLRRKISGDLDDNGYVQCVADCNTRFGVGGRNRELALTDCAKCGAKDVPACISCLWTYVAHAGIEIGLVALVLLGLYLWLK